MFLCLSKKKFNMSLFLLLLLLFFVLALFLYFPSLGEGQFGIFFFKELEHSVWGER